MENGLKVCVVTLVKRGRYDYETMHVHHVIAKPDRAVAIFSTDVHHVIAKPATHHVIAKPDRAVAIFLNGLGTE